MIVVVALVFGTGAYIQPRLPKPAVTYHTRTYRFWPFVIIVGREVPVEVAS